MKNVFNFFSWFFGLFFIMGGVGNLFLSNALFALLTIVAGILLLPPVKEKLIYKYPFLSYGKITLVGVVIFFIASIFNGFQERSGPINSDIKIEEISNESENAVEVKTYNPNWIYSENKDEMRSETTFFAETTSLNFIDLDFPYQGGSYLSLVIRKVENSSDEVMFIINKGQLWCEYNNCKIAVKFDDKPVEEFFISEASAGSSETMFLESKEQEFVSKLKESKNTIIEIGIYNSSRQQFKFDTSDLIW